MRLAFYLIPLLLLSACDSSIDRKSASSTQPAISTTAETSPPGDRAEIVRVFDGDSFVATLDDGSEVEIRLLGINAPEGSDCHGDQSRQTLDSLLRSGTLTLVADSETTDQFNRDLRYAYVDGLNVNLEMVRSGNALALQTDHTLNNDFVESGDTAAANRIGMWAGDICGEDRPPPSVTIVDYVYDPRGRDTDDLNGEWIAIANQGSDPVDMTGWILRDESTQNRFLFPSRFTLAPGNEVLVRSGCGSDTGTELFWCARDPVWSNGGDTVILQQNTGVFVARERYAGNF